MSEWKKVRLGEIVKINPLFTLKKGVVAKKVAMDKITPHCRDISSYAEESYSGGVKFINGCTLMARITPCLENGKIAQVRFLGNNEVAFGSTEFIVFQGVDGVSDKDFIYYLINTDLIRQKAIDSMVGSSGRQRAQSDEIAKITISLPPLPTQRKIAAVLGALDDKIENNRKICANLEAQAQAIFKSWFVDFEPFGGKMPQGWKMEPLEGMAEQIASGGTPRTKEESYYKGLIRWYSTKELKDCFLFDSEKHISEDAVANSAAKVFPRNTILMAIYAAPTVGRLGILDSESTFNQAAVGIVARQEIGYAYLYLQLLNAREALNLMAVGSCQQNLNVGVVKSYQVLRPDDVILCKFNNLVDGLFDEIRALTKETRSLAAMRDALLPKLMSGEIDVEKVEVA